MERIRALCSGCFIWIGGDSSSILKGCQKVYAHCTAGVLRAKDDVLKQVTTLKENCDDIYEEAKLINEERAKREKEAELHADTETKKEA